MKKDKSISTDGCLVPALTLTGLPLIPIIVIIIIFLTSCSYRLQGSHGEPLHSNAAYRSIYYHPYRVHNERWYNKHQIYWQWRPQFNSRHYKKVYSYQDLLQNKW
jgi:hypothetical protein